MRLAALTVTLGLLGACGARHPSGAGGGRDAVGLGWRLVPGMELTYACATTYRSGGEEVSRVEHWSYLVRDLDGGGVAQLEARLTGFGAGLSLGGLPLDAEYLDAPRQDEVARLSAAPVEVTLSMDGVARAERGSWSDRLPHRMLGLALPTAAVSPGQSWPDPGLTRAVADLLPAGLELDLESRSVLEAVEVRDGLTQARVSTDGHIYPADPKLPGGVSVAGEAWWDLRAGQLTERTLTLTTQGDTAEPERLEVTLRLIQ